MTHARRWPKKPIGFKPEARMFYLTKAIEYRKMEIQVSAAGAKALTASTEYVVISPGVNSRTDKPETLVFPVNKDGYCLSWFGIGSRLEGHPTPASVLKSLGYQLDGD